MKKSYLAVAAALALGSVVVLTGCSSGKSYSESTGKQAKEKVLRIGSDISFPPFEFKEDGKQKGFDIELAEAVSKEMGAKLEVKDITFSDLIPAVKDNKIDAILSGFEGTEERAKDLSYSDPYLPAGYSVLTTKDSSVKDWGDLKGKVIATQTGTTHTAISVDFGAERVHAFEEKDNVIKALKEKKVDAIVVDTPVALYYAKHDDHLVVAGAPRISKTGLVFAVKKGNTELQKEINEALKKVKDNGTYDKIYKEWFGDQAIK